MSSPEHSSLQSEEFLIFSPTSATMQLCYSMRLDAGHGELSPKCSKALTTSVKWHWGAICKMRTPSGRESGDSIMQSKKVASGRKGTKQEKSRSGLSVCTTAEHCTAVLASKAQEAALHKDGIFTRAKPWSLCREKPYRFKHPFAWSGPDEWAQHRWQNTRSQWSLCFLQLQPCGCPGPCHFCNHLPRGCLLCSIVLLYWGMHLKHLKRGPGVRRTHALLFFCMKQSQADN